MNFGNVNELHHLSQKQCFSSRNGSILSPQTASQAVKWLQLSSVSEGLHTLPCPGESPFTSHIHTLKPVMPIYLFSSVREGNDHSKDKHGRVFSASFPLLSLMCNTGVIFVTIKSSHCLLLKFSDSFSVLFEWQTWLCLLLASTSPAQLTSLHGCVALISFWPSQGKDVSIWRMTLILASGLQWKESGGSIGYGHTPYKP